MDKMQGAMANLTVDRRAQALLIGFGFGAFLEGICGFGAPVAIPASILVGLGYDPMLAALVCLVANTGPVPFGSLAIPTDTLAPTTGLDVMKVSQMTGRLMAPLAFLMSFATVFAMSRGRGVKGALPAILVTGASFSAVELLVSNVLGPTLTDVLASLTCLTATALYLRSAHGAYPLLSPVFGTIGVFLTGSNTSSNPLFGNLQKLTARGHGLSDVLMASSGSAGGAPAR